MRSFEEMLTGGHPNSLGNTVEVVNIVLADPSKFDELFQCYVSEDEVVRLRVSNAMKRIAKENKALLIPYLDRLLSEVAALDQASAQWTLAQLFLTYEKDMTAGQGETALSIMKKNVSEHRDWIVLSQTMTTLGKWAKKDQNLKEWLHPHLACHAQDERTSVAKKAAKVMASLKLE